MRIVERHLRSFIRESFLTEADSTDKAYVPHDIFKRIKYGIEAGGGFVDNYYVAAAAMAYDRKDYDKMLRFLVASHPYLAPAAKSAGGSGWRVTLDKDQRATVDEDRRIIRAFLSRLPDSGNVVSRFDSLVADSKSGKLGDVTLAPDEDAAIQEFLENGGYLDQESKEITRSVNQLTGKTQTDRNYISGLNKDILYKNLFIALDITGDELWLYVSGNKDQIPESRRQRISQYLDDLLLVVGFFPPAAAETFVAYIVKLILEKRWDELKNLVIFGAVLGALGATAGRGIAGYVAGRTDAAWAERSRTLLITENLVDLSKLSDEGKSSALAVCDAMSAGLGKLGNIVVPEVTTAISEAKAAINAGEKIDLSKSPETAEVTKKLYNAVFVEKPVVLPAEMRTGRDWFDGLTGLSPGGHLGDEARDRFMGLRDEALSLARKLELNPGDSTSRDRLEKIWASLSMDSWRSELSSGPAKMNRAKSIMSSADFADTAKSLYGKLGIDVNIIPIVGAQDNVFSKYLNKYPQVLVNPVRLISTRLVIVPADEGKAILDSVRGVTSTGEEVLVNTQGVGPDKITIVPITNSAGVDSMPRPWMISHAIFDSAAGNLLIDQGLMPKTKALVNSVEEVYESIITKLGELKKTRDFTIRYAPTPEEKAQIIDKLKTSPPDVERAVISRINVFGGGREAEDMIGMTVDSLWGRNARAAVQDLSAEQKKIVDAIIAIRKTNPEILRAQEVHDLIKSDSKIAAIVSKEMGVPLEEVVQTFDLMMNRGRNVTPAPFVGQKYKGLGVDRSRSKPNPLFKQDSGNLSGYISRPMTDHIAEIMTSSIVKTEGYVAKFDHLAPEVQIFYGEEGTQIVKEAGAELERILGPGGQNAKAAFADDLEGKVLFVFPD